MSTGDGCKHYFYPGVGEKARETMHYAQAIRVEKKIFCSGQGALTLSKSSAFPRSKLTRANSFYIAGGWDRETSEISTVLEEEVNQAFENVAANLKHAGGKGWPQVYRVVTYSTDMKATFDFMVANLRKHMPGHYPTWTALGVKELGLPTMHIEIEVEAYDPDGAVIELGQAKI